ncbi:hypothetical protein [Actinoplanes sp. NPDC023714]|uniref:hypothetical protein n=1 Tax=Actinoplanes sp. NPDC023714 TaxID=3154322 RepID=UPI0033C7D39B
MLLLTIGGAAWTFTSVEPDYIATAHVQLVTPSTVLQTPDTKVKTPTEVARNPWLDLGLGALSAAGSVTVQDQEIVEQLEAADLSTNFTVETSNQVPLVTFEVVGSSKEEATKTVDFLAKNFDNNVLALQESYGAPKNEMISTKRLDLGSNVTESTSKVKRALVAVAGAGLLLTAALTISVDAYMRRRNRRRELLEAGPEAPATTETSSPVPVQRNGSSAAPQPVQPMQSVQSLADRAGLDRTVRITAPTMSRAGSTPVNGAANGGAAPAANGGEAKNGIDAPKSPPPADATIVLPNNIYGGMYGRRGENKDRQ